ncbi:MAG: MBL fold metallo-hydrolase [Actinomycetota bacterium]
MELDYSTLVKPIREDILHIDIPIPHVLRNVNLYLFLGREPALIDAGPFHPLLAEVVEGALRYAGGNRLSRLYLTHSHIDHFGLAERVRRSTGAMVAAHRDEAPRIERVKSRLRREYRCYAALSVELGFPSEFSDAVFSLAHRWIELSEPCPLEVKLKGGEKVPAGDRLLEVLHTPGHTAGHLCFYEPSEGLLFSGDHLMRSITPNPELYCPPRRGQVTGLPQFIASLERIREIPVEVAYPGHGRPIGKVRRRIDFNILHHRKRLEKTEEAVREGGRTVWEVALRLFPQVRDKDPDVDHFLALKEALGHLLILEERGAVRRHVESGVWKFVPAPAAPGPDVMPHK